MENDVYATALLAMGGLLVGLGLVIIILCGSAAWERRRRVSRRSGFRSFPFIFAASDGNSGGWGTQSGCGDGHGGWGHGDSGGCDGSH